MAQSKPGPLPQAKGNCPICRAPTVHETRPFCSKRCADVDLSRWLSGAYVIQGASHDDDEDGDNADGGREQTERPREPED
jgi:uncharacterized protein